MIQVAIASRFAKTFMEEIPECGKVCREMHSGSRKVRMGLPFAPFTGMRCTECGLCVTDWHPLKSLVWIALIGWWWKGSEK